MRETHEPLAARWPAIPALQEAIRAMTSQRWTDFEAQLKKALSALPEHKAPSPDATNYPAYRQRNEWYFVDALRDTQTRVRTMPHLAAIDIAEALRCIPQLIEQANARPDPTETARQIEEARVLLQRRKGLPAEQVEDQKMIPGNFGLALTDEMDKHWVKQWTYRLTEAELNLGFIIRSAKGGDWEDVHKRLAGVVRDLSHLQTAFDSQARLPLEQRSAEAISRCYVHLAIADREPKPEKPKQKPQARKPRLNASPAPIEQPNKPKAAALAVNDIPFPEEGDLTNINFPELGQSFSYNN